MTCTSVQIDTFDFGILRSNPGVRTDLFARKLDETLLTDFFGGVSDVELTADDDDEDYDDVPGALLDQQHALE